MIEIKVSRHVVDKRHQDILNFLHQNQIGTVSQLSKNLHVSNVTIRRDLDLLEEQGHISRYFGGAKIAENTKIATLFCSDPKSDAIQSIAKTAAGLLEDGDTVFINSSYTALQVYQYLNNKNIVIITNNGNSLQINRPAGVELVLTGGEVYEKKLSLVGEYTLDTISKVKCHKCLIGVSGISVEGGITSAVLAETAVNKLMIANSTGIKIVVADSSKVGIVQNFFSSPIESVTHLVTDSNADPEEVKKIRTAGLEVIVAAHKIQ